MYGLQPADLVMILIVALVIFGPKRLPELARSLGQGITEFKEATRGVGRSDQPAPSPASPILLAAPAAPATQVAQIAPPAAGDTTES